MKNDVGVCVINKDGEIEKLQREYYRQGNIFKSWDAYYNRPEDPCYVPELSCSVYSAKDFLDMCDGQKDFADELFEGVDWQHPETLMEDWIREGEWTICENCDRIIDTGSHPGLKKCPRCGKKI